MEIYRETIAGREQWVGCARQHKCEFKGSLFPSAVIIANLTSPLVIFPAVSEATYVQGVG
jgi:hypothetical protein